MIFVFTKKQLKITAFALSFALVACFTAFNPDLNSNILTTSKNDWGLSYRENGAQPEGNATAEFLKEHNAYYCVPTDEKVIYLTFDAGYDNGNTTPILDALKKHNVKSTFFLVGNFIEKNPDLVKRMVDEGHIVGNHTKNHPDMSKIATAEEFAKEIAALENDYKAVTGKELLKVYRPPQGKFNEENLKLANSMGYKTFFWSLAYVDWYENKQPTKEEAFSKLLTRIHPGAIVLLHSTSKTNAEILDELLTKWEEMGYTFKNLDSI
ncbi:MAG: polysaccharide deacetylase family protein [Clostridia bacterium]|nr:polysaccharide deacetylase family protein [Clostridia bacterium]